MNWSITQQSRKNLVFLRQIFFYRIAPLCFLRSYKKPRAPIERLLSSKDLLQICFILLIRAELWEMGSNDRNASMELSRCHIEIETLKKEENISIKKNCISSSSKKVIFFHWKKKEQFDFNLLMSVFLHFKTLEQNLNFSWIVS